MRRRGTPARKYQKSKWYFIVWAMGGREQATLFQTSWADIEAAPDTEEIEGNDFLDLGEYKVPWASGQLLRFWYRRMNKICSVKCKYNGFLNHLFREDFPP
jgi:hypothetical protein